MPASCAIPERRWSSTRRSRGRAFGAALADAVDAALVDAFAGIEDQGEVALVALGSYGRRELCPGSDIDVLLLHNLKSRRALASVRDMTERLWYPLWDAGFVTGHGARTVRDSVALADQDLDALTALLDVRLVAGSEALAEELERKVRDLARKRQARVLRALADGADVRRARPGLIAEMLEPDVKEGAGGLRDVQSLQWAGWVLGDAGGATTLLARGYLAPDDLARVETGAELLLDTRVALQRVTSARSDRLALQEQDAVAEQLGVENADVLVHDLASAARDIAWITADVWMRVRDMLAGPAGRGATHDRLLAEGVFLRDGRVHVTPDEDGTVPPLRTLEAAVAAADEDAPFDRASLTRLQATRVPTWDVWERAAFVRLLRAGAAAVPVFEALDYEGVLTRFLPEWEHVRSRPQRNAYHRYTVDRHLLEAVAQCARLLDAGDAHAAGPGVPDIDAIVARACRRPELLLFGALLHDISKGMPGDHSEVGAGVADRVARRMHFDSEGREIVGWLVRHHLLMAGARDAPRPFRRVGRRQPRGLVLGRRRALAPAVPPHDRRFACDRTSRVEPVESRARARPVREGRGRDRARRGAGRRGRPTRGARRADRSRLCRRVASRGCRRRISSRSTSRQWSGTTPCWDRRRRSVAKRSVRAT